MQVIVGHIHLGDRSCGKFISALNNFSVFIDVILDALRKWKAKCLQRSISLV